MTQSTLFDIVLYHANCSDGMMAAYAYWYTTKTWFVDKNGKSERNILCIPVNYNLHKEEPSATIKLINDHIEKAGLNKENHVGYVLIADFNFPVAHLEAISKDFGRVVVLDHHPNEDFIKEVTKNKDWDTTRHLRLGNMMTSEITNEMIQQLNETRSYTNDFGAHEGNTISVYLNSNVSGAYLTWVYLNFTIPPDYVCYVSDRDLWQFKYEETMPFHSGMSLVRDENGEFSPEMYQEALKDVKSIIDQGKVLLKAKQMEVNRIIQNAPEFFMLGIQERELKIGIRNADMAIASDLCSAMLDKHQDLDAMMVYVIDRRGSVKCSIRSKKDGIANLVARHFGGGGHPNASGFVIDIDTLKNFLGVRQKLFSQT